MKNTETKKKTPEQYHGKQVGTTEIRKHSSYGVVSLNHENNNNCIPFRRNQQKL